MSELKNKMEWTCACGASLNIRGQGQFAAAMLQNFVNLHPCSLGYLNAKDDDDEDEERHDSATDSYHERRGSYQENSNERFGQETPAIIGFQPNDPEPQPTDGPDYHAEHAAWVSRNPR